MSRLIGSSTFSGVVATDVIQLFPLSLGLGYFLVRVHVAMAGTLSRMGRRREERAHYRDADVLMRRREGYDFSWVWEGNDAQVYYDMAGYHGLAGQPEKALRMLRKARTCGWADWPLLEREESLAPVHESPEFKALVADGMRGRRSLG